MNGMVKLIYSSAFGPECEVSMRLVEDPAVLTKSASTIFGCGYDQLKPDADHVGIHLTAVGAFERYGSNRNGDSFPKAACVKYHDTFVKHGQLFRHHRNKDRAANLGNVKASAYNDGMDRIELFVHAHKERFAPELARLEKEGEIPFSMACRVPGDRCSVCQQFRKNSSDPAMCDHIRYELGKLANDGTITCTHNDDPDFFDISGVGRPADRIAFQLKVASGEMMDSVKLAEAEGLWIPDYMAIESAESLQKLAYLKRISVMQQAYRGWASKQASVRTPVDRYFHTLQKAAGADLCDSALAKLREYEPRDAFQAMARAGVVLTVPQFFKYAMGPAYSEIEAMVPSVAACVGAVIDAAVKEGACQHLCNDVTFDVPVLHMGRAVAPECHTKLAEASILGHVREERIITATLDGRITKIAVDNSGRIQFNTHEIVMLAEKYAAYELSAVAAIFSLHPDTDKDSVLAVTAAQNLID